MLIFVQIVVSGLRTHKSNFRKEKTKAVGKKSQDWKVNSLWQAALPLILAATFMAVFLTCDLMMQRKLIRKLHFQIMRVCVGKTLNITGNIFTSKAAKLCINAWRIEGRNHPLQCVLHTSVIILQVCITPEQCRCRCVFAREINQYKIKAKSNNESKSINFQS